MISAGLARDWAFLLSLFGEAVPRRLTFALLPHFMLCNCLAVAFLSPASAGAEVPRPPRVPLYPGTELCQAPKLPAALGLWWGLKVRLHNAGRVGAGGRGCVRRRDKSPAFPPSFLVGPGLTSPRRKKDRDGTFCKF